MPETTMSFTKAARQFFGLKDGQRLTDFAGELKDLTEDDKNELAPMLAVEVGVDVVTVGAAKA